MKGTYLFVFGTFIILLILSILNGYFFNYLNDAYFHYSSNENGLQTFNAATKLLIIGVISPVIETYVFQHLPNKGLQKMHITNAAFLIILPSVIFGAFHFYFWLYAIAAFIGGIFINTLYVVVKPRIRYYLIIVILFHSCYNLYGYLLVVK